MFQDEPLVLKQWIVLDPQHRTTTVALVDPRQGVEERHARHGRGQVSTHRLQRDAERGGAQGHLPQPSQGRRRDCMYLGADRHVH